MTLPCSNLNLNLYRVFYIVAKTKSFSESSKVLHISQPAISKHIQNLEYELNTLLFYRNNRGIELTPEAKNLLIYVEKAYNFLMLGEKQLQESKELLQGKVSVGMPTVLSNYYFTNHIREFMQKHSKIVIKMANQNTNSLLNLLNQHTLDILIIPGNVETNKDLNRITIKKDEYCFVYNPEKMNVEADSLEKLNNYPLLLPVKTTEERKKIEEVFSENSLSVSPIMELETNEMMLNYINEGFGIGYVLKEVALKNSNLQIIDLKEKLPEVEINIIYDDASLTYSSKEFINEFITSNI